MEILQETDSVSVCVRCVFVCVHQALWLTHEQYNI